MFSNARRVLSQCNTRLRLLYLLIQTGWLPKLWKLGNITRIHEDGDRWPVENYRGFSLLTVTGKGLKRIVYNAIYNEVISFIHDSHHGFLTGRSCTTQLLLIHHDWFKVRRDILLAKLYKYGVHGDLFN